MKMEEISRENWAKTHRDYKSIIKGQRYVLKFDKQLGTVLTPVNIKKKIKNL